jgi:ABC-2 type transport system ATP-binding protein
MMADRVWGASAVSVRFDSVIALDGVSVTASPGRVTAVVGGDGAGKTTLLRCIAGGLTPNSGTISNPGPLRIGYLPTSSGVYTDLTVAENLSFRGTAYGMRESDLRRRTEDLMAAAGLADARDRLGGNLSGGMRQKLGVIAALLHNPELVVLDEPTTGVDPVSRSGLWELITNAAASGAAVILATTYLDDAERAGSVLVLDRGRELAAGTPDEIITAMPGSLRWMASRPDGLTGRRAWRRGASWRVWCPPGEPTGLGEPVTPDLQDAVTVASLDHELRAATAAASGIAGPTREAGVPEPGEQARAETAVRPAAQAASTAAPLVECVGVTRRFGDFTAVSDVGVQIMPGEIVGLLGANGAGKTTLIRMLLGLIPVSAGEVVLLGRPPSRETRGRIGYVPQGLGLYEDLTAAENLDFAAAVFGGHGAVSAGQPASLPGDLLGLDGIRGVPVGRLPLGLQRRVAFTQALAHRPELLMLDEPTSGVDPLGRARLWETISGAARDGAGVLVSTHYMEEAEECDRLVIMAAGAVVATGTAKQIVGDMRVTVVQAASWSSAFQRLAAAGLAVALAGQTLRVPGASPDEVSAVLASDSARPGQPAGNGTSVWQAPATLEERFFDLVLRTSGERVAA